jgi:hypothetical protein
MAIKSHRHNVLRWLLDNGAPPLTAVGSYFSASGSSSRSVYSLPSVLARAQPAISLVANAPSLYVLVGTVCVTLRARLCGAARMRLRKMQY